MSERLGWYIESRAPRAEKKTEMAKGMGSISEIRLQTFQLLYLNMNKLIFRQTIFRQTIFSTQIIQGFELNLQSLENENVTFD